MGEEGRREEKQRRGEKTRFNGVTQDPSPTEPTQQQLGTDHLDQPYLNKSSL